MKEAIIIVGLGYGDESKGSITDFLCESKNADLVIKYTGGHQSGHTVVRDNRRHIFSQFGSGTLLGVPTYLGKNFIVNPLALKPEADALIKLGIEDPYSLLTIHPRCLVTIPHFIDLNRAKCQEKNCSVGVGMWETVRYALANREDAIYFEDLYDRVLISEKIKYIEERLENEYWRYSDCEFNWDNDRIIDDLQRIANHLQYKTTPPNFNYAVFEGSQGSLLDAYKGFYPFNCATPTTGRHAIEMLSELHVDDYTAIGVIRPYLTRHGAGPFPTETLELKIENKVPNNEFTGPFRLGWFDFKLLEYALKINDLDGCPIDSFAISCIDHVEDQSLKYCDGYANDIEYKIPFDLDDAEENCQKAFMAVPNYIDCNFTELSEKLVDFFHISICSFGETAKDKLWL